MMKSFIIYQLGNTLIQSGIGCGYYDASGKKDEKGISKAINDYLFEYCFNPSRNENNYRHFLDYLLINFSRVLKGRGNIGFMPNLPEFTKVLFKDQLTEYWKINCNNIKTKGYENEDKKVFTSNYVASYALDLESTFKVLDELL